jgi:EAL domain-containing protein (putative c-di-GMP-specific phosphodiesterase class I)
MAFQPIVDVVAGRVYAYEALVRGPGDDSAWGVLQRVTPENKYAFDQNCRVKAITLAAELGLAQTGAMLSINFIPGAVYSPAACIALTLKTAARVGFPTDRLIFELTEGERVSDRAHLRGIVDEYRRRGFRMAIDDFGAGYSGLALLSDFPVEIVKLDMELIRSLHERPRARAIVQNIVALAGVLGADVIAEGVETESEYAALRDCGIRLIQGYLLARPKFEALPNFTVPAAAVEAA